MAAELCESLRIFQGAGPDGGNFDPQGGKNRSFDPYYRGRYRCPYRACVAHLPVAATKRAP